MIDLSLIQKIFKNHIIELKQNYYKIYKHSNTIKKIFICRNDSFNAVLNFSLNNKNMFYTKNKQCIILKEDFIHIYIHEDYIKYIIRHKYLNTLLND